VALNKLKLKISTPTEPTPPGRGFYQMEEDSLYVPIGGPAGSRRFFSFLEAEHVRLDLDRHGRLVFIEVNLPRSLWSVNPELSKPENAHPSDVRWLDFRTSIANPTLTTDRKRASLLIGFSEDRPTAAFYLAESVILQTNGSGKPVSIWVGQIESDRAGQAIAAFRRANRVEDDHAVDAAALPADNL